MHLVLLVALSAYAQAVDRAVPMPGDPRNEPVTAVVLHATGGPSCDASVAFRSGTLDGIVAYFQSRDDGVGIHYVIGRDGTTVSMVPDTLVAHHALGVSAHTIGVELVNNGDGEDPFPAAQTAALGELLAGVLARYHLGPEALTTHAAVDGLHVECVTGADGAVVEVPNTAGRGFARSQDPGTNFPLRAVRGQVRQALDAAALSE